MTKLLSEKLSNISLHLILVYDEVKVKTTSHPLPNNFLSVAYTATTTTGTSVARENFVAEDIYPLINMSNTYFSDHQVIWIGINLQVVLSYILIVFGVVYIKMYQHRNAIPHRLLMLPNQCYITICRCVFVFPCLAHFWEHSSVPLILLVLWYKVFVV